jgi:hypothetical protein
MASKISIDTCARQLKERVAGKGIKEWVSYFWAGVVPARQYFPVIDPKAKESIHKDEVAFVDIWVNQRTAARPRRCVEWPCVAARGIASCGALLDRPHALQEILRVDSAFPIIEQRRPVCFNKFLGLFHQVGRDIFPADAVVVDRHGRAFAAGNQWGRGVDGDIDAGPCCSLT